MIFKANVFSKLQTVKIFVRKLSQEHRFRTGFGSQHVKASQLLPKSPRERFYHVILSFAMKLIWNMSPLLLGEMLRMFVNTLAIDLMYPVQGCENLQLPIQMQLSEKRTSFSQFFFHFWILNQILNIWKQKMIVIVNVFPKLQTVKILVRALSKNRRFRARFDSHHVKASQMLAKSS